MFAFADDGTIVTTMDYTSLKRIKTILEMFGKISGLECNVEKTTLMQFGTINPITDDIHSLGFEISNSLTILGLKINSDSLDFQENWDKILQKVSNQIRLWIRFNLSLTGRINIAKTMLYSQINYLGCFLPVPERIIELLEDLIEDFVKGSLQIAKKRLYLSPESGGLGLFQIESFLISQKIAWTVRALNFDEIWKVRMYVYGNGNVLNYRSCMIDRNKTPILHGFATAYKKFLCAYTKHKENFWQSPIYENAALFLRLRDRITLSADFFTPLFWAENKGTILKLTVQDFFVTKDNFKTWEQFRHSTGLDLNREAFNNLKNLASNAKLKYSKKEANDKKTVDIRTYLSRKVKGCKRYRKKLIGLDPEFVPHNLVKFSSNTETIIDLETSKKVNAVWNKSYFSNATRTFLFKLHNNTAGYNKAVSHFIRGHSPNCTFCDLTGNQEVEDETVLHLFYSCRTSESFIENIFSWILGERANISRQEFFVNFNRPNHKKNEALFLISMLVKKFMWDSKQRFSLPNIENAKIFIKEEVKIMCYCSKKARKIFLNSEIEVLQG
jgi:hypothetical protein